MLEGVQADHYLTSEGLINEDTIVSSEEGLKKTEYLQLSLFSSFCSLYSAQFVSSVVSVSRGPVQLPDIDFHSDLYGGRHVRDWHRLLYPADQPV